jgi:hypothetical protein
MSSPSITQLQSDWFSFSDLDRAKGVLAIKETGISVRSIAAQLHLSEALLRHLLKALLASARDQGLASQGTISTNELVRRSEVGLSGAKHDGEPTSDRGRESRTAADLICHWLLQTELIRPAREMIVKEVQRKFLLMKDAGLHSSAVAPPDTPIHQIIRLTKPPAMTDDRIDVVSWLADWLCKWCFFAFPDEDVRNCGLSLALEKQQAR